MNTETAKPLVSITVPPVAGYKLELLPGEFSGTWQQAVAWAKEQGGELPTRAEQTLLLEHARDEFKRDWYWSGEQAASASGYAWVQLFSYGTQLYDHKSYKYRARAVRRVPL